MEANFIDLYEVMQISPNTEPDRVQRVFRMLASRLHPDNPYSGDREAFALLNRAYGVLSNPEMRAAYDTEHANRRSEPLKIFESREFATGLDGESNRRLGLMCLLYARRRSDVDNPGISLLDLEGLMSTPREHLLFATWYLREKQFVTMDDRSNLLITADGVDHLEQNLQSNRIVYRLLKEGANAQINVEDERNAIEAPAAVQ